MVSLIDLSRENADAANYLDSLNDPAIDLLVSTYRVIHIGAGIGQRAYELLK